MGFIQEFSYEKKGFLPVMFEKTWQVAILNYMDEQHIDNLDKIDVHFETDEVFILLKGDAWLITANKQNDIILEWDIKKIQPNIVYNIPATYWHNIAMKEGSSVVIVERNGTHNGDFAFHYLIEKDKEVLRNLVKDTT